LLLDTDKDGITAWHCAAERVNLEIILKLYYWAKKKLMSEDIINILLRTDNDGSNA